MSSIAQVNCCLCSKTIKNNEKRERVGAPSMYEHFKNHVGERYEEYSMFEYVCKKCSMKISSSKLKLLKKTRLAEKTFKSPENAETFADPILPKRNRIEAEPNINKNAPGTSKQAINHYSRTERPSCSTAIEEVTNSESSNYTVDESEEFFSSENISVAPSQLCSVDQSVPSSESQFSLSSFTSSSTKREYTAKMLNGTEVFIIPNVSSVAATNSKCFICNEKTDRSKVPKTARLDVMVKLNISIPKSNRCCKTHLEYGKFTEDALAKIKVRKSFTEMTGIEVGDWIQDLSKLVNVQRNPLDFSLSSGLTAEDYNMIMGISTENFEMMLGHCQGGFLRNSSNRTVRNGLAMTLMKFRLNLSQSVLAFLFGVKNQSVVSETIDKITLALEEKFVPLYLGYNHLTREQLLTDHQREFFSSVLEKEPDDLILILDGTYLYVQKSSNLKLQHQTFSLHKHRNLVKPMMVVLPSGYILDVEGMFFADNDNSDAKILNYMLNKQGSIRSALQPGDTLVLDRGFQRALSEADDYGYYTFMPQFLAKNQKQFTTEQANDSRRVTLLRWIVESANGRIKNKFKFFEDVIPITYSPKIKRFFRIACAMINAFCVPLFTETDWHKDIIDLIHTRRSMKENDLQTEVESLQLNRGNCDWDKANEDDALDFPMLTLEELKKITLGPYQIRMGELYNEQHLQNEIGYEFVLHKELPGLIRVHMKSRYRKGKSHKLWVKYEPGSKGEDGILGYYCLCQCGARTLGCCSHVAAVLRYLGYDRFEIQSSRVNIGLGFLNAVKTFDDGEESEEESDEEA